MPPDDRRGDFVTQGEQKRRGVCRQPAHHFFDVPANLPLKSVVVEKGDVFRPRNAHEDPQPMPTRLVHQRLIRNRVGSNGVDTHGRHRFEIFRDTVRWGKLTAGIIGRERAIRHPADQRSFSTNMYEFSGHPNLTGGSLDSSHIERHARCLFTSPERVTVMTGVILGWRREKPQF